MRCRVQLRVAGAAIALAGAIGMGAAQPASEATQPPAMMAADAHPVFEVATIKPTDPKVGGGGFHLVGRHVLMKNETVDNLIALAYGVQAKQVVGGPGVARYRALRHRRRA